MRAPMATIEERAAARSLVVPELRALVEGAVVEYPPSSIDPHACAARAYLASGRTPRFPELVALLVGLCVGSGATLRGPATARGAVWCATHCRGCGVEVKARKRAGKRSCRACSAAWRELGQPAEPERRKAA